MENNLSQDYTEDDNRMEPELEEYGNSNSDEFYFKLYDILRFPEEDVSDYIEDMEDVTLFYDEYSIRYILEKGFFCVDDVKGFSVRLRRCLANAKSRVIDDVSESEIINKNAANLLRFNPTNSCDKLALLTSGASKRIMARVNYFNKRDRVEELLKSSLKDHIALLASRKRCEDRANREILISGFRSQGHPFDTLFENRRDYDISGDFEGFQRLLMDTQDAIEYLSNYQNELVENLLSALKYTKEDKCRQEQETKKAEEELTSAKEELRAVKEDPWFKHMTRENVVKKIAAKRDDAIRDNLTSLVESLLPKDMHEEFNDEVDASFNKKYKKEKQPSITTNIFLDESKLVDNSKTIKINSDDNNKQLPQ